MLIKNGYGKYSVHSTEVNEEFEKTRALLKLMTELNKGFQSGKQQGWKTEEDLDRYFAEKRRQKEAEVKS